jgi:stage II sporulation protein AA (anti-sigma F factor antagonist)
MSVTPVQVVMQNETVIAVVSGDLDAVSAAAIGDDLVQAALGTHGSRSIVIDIRDVPFTDSCGLYALVRARDHLVERGVECYVVATDNSLTRRLLEITELDAILSVHGRMGDALEAARRRLPA